MNSYLIALISFACIFGGAIAGFLLQPFLPKHHLSKESQDSVKLGAGLIATMAALILGLLVSSSKGTYDRVNSLVNDAAANAISLDQELRNFGPEAQDLHQIVKERVITFRDHIWPERAKSEVKGSEAIKNVPRTLSLTRMIASLKSADPAAQQMQSTALQIIDTLNRDRWKITVEASSKLPLMLVVIPVFWITFLTFVYGLLAPRNGTVLTVLFFCSLSIAGAIFLICEMSMPLDGSIKVPSRPFDTAIELIGK